MFWSSTIYPTRYAAQKAMRIAGEMLAIVKVDDGQGSHGYMLMEYQNYHIWRRNIRRGPVK